MRGVGSGVEVDDYADYEIGDTITIDGEDYTIVRIESLSKYTDGVYEGRPAFLVLRGFTL